MVRADFATRSSFEGANDFRVIESQIRAREIKDLGVTVCGPSGVRDALGHTIPLQEVEPPRQGRLLDGERVVELPQIRLAQSCDRRENTELSDRRPLGRRQSS